MSQQVDNYIQGCVAIEHQQKVQVIQLELATAEEKSRPFMLLRPRLAKDGDKWICCYGGNIQEGVVGIGDTPDAASRDFDRAWRSP